MSSAEASPGAPGRLELRRYRDDDVRAVRELHDLALTAAGVHLGRGPWDEDLDDISGTYLDTGGDFLLGSVDGRLAAIGALLHVSQTDAEIKRMRVHPRFQRRGFARAVLAQLEAYAREHEYRRLRLSTTLLQITAQRLFAREGYHEVGRGQVAGVPMIYYAKRLT
ncbi:MAG: GNAT family N-acetyltransferase [Solirubrobacteraceae bacterium]